MTDLEVLTEMFTRCGHKFTTEGPADTVFWDSEYEGMKRIDVKYHANVITMTVNGCFYDELYVYFSPEGELLEMMSHVAYVRPTTPALKKRLREVDRKER